jgi:leucyl/phenylalanyl-tRNA--protein transferase
MPVWLIPEGECFFPHPAQTDASGIVAVGGDLSVETLLLAYQFGIFPWYGQGEPVLWWFPDPRAILYPSKVRIHKSMRPYFNQPKFTISLDSEFNQVILQCRLSERRGQENATWIHDEIMEAYVELYEAGFAHSLEVLEGEELVGGLYGVALGKVFFGESMFSTGSNASKFGLIALCQFLEYHGFQLIDCQQDTPHMRRMGSEVIAAGAFLDQMRRNIFEPHLKGSWRSLWDDRFLNVR